jgi:hypothetical protein
VSDPFQKAALNSLTNTGSRDSQQIPVKTVNAAVAVTANRALTEQNRLFPPVLPHLGRRAATPARIPHFLPTRNFYRFRWWDQLRDLFTSPVLSKGKTPQKIFGQIPLLAKRFAAEPFLGSLLAHLIAIPLLSFLLQIVPRQVPRENESRFVLQSVIYYRLPKLQTHAKLPSILTPGSGSTPVSGLYFEHKRQKRARRNPWIRCMSCRGRA